MQCCLKFLTAAMMVILEKGIDPKYFMALGIGVGCPCDLNPSLPLYEALTAAVVLFFNLRRI